ncbi:putative pentatricopeptide repeat-containing protein At3g05240 [Lolium perenne]|uniref:putative pentatricopeptide repeat-containing protein At3g05240 n=1 Tax=Lolium perenne TaxID=4522 RepID=UPI0021EB2716|nr:putative pentatricopeptide repeat-containing protein At3g05240 [Lolium perenne]
MVRSSGDVVWWTKRISALARSGRAAEAVAEFARMDAAPNALTLASVLPACARLRSLALGRAIHGFWLRRGGGPGANPILDNAVLDVYAKCGALRSARRLFDGMPERDVFSWTALVWGLARSGSPQDAVAMFRAMLSDGEAAPNEATVVSVLHAVACTGSLACGKVLHSYALKRGLGGEQVVGNALTDAYAKCGEARLALEVFDLLPDKEDLVSWGTVMRAMAVHGRCREALQLFSLMLRRGVRPDGAVFLALLYACCHVGLADQALHILGAMRRVYGIAPWREHYTCVLDACGRAGHLDGAAEIFRRMPMKRDRQVLGAYCSYASSSKVNGASGERFWERILDREVDAGGGTYALMSKSMASAGQWDDACAVRETMAARRIDKAAACTWIEV